MSFCSRGGGGLSISLHAGTHTHTRPAPRTRGRHPPPPGSRYRIFHLGSRFGRISRIERYLLFGVMYINKFNKSIFPGADPVGGPREPGPPPFTLGFEAPKLSIFGPYLIFPSFSLPRFARHIISLICCFFKVQIQKFSSLTSLGI